jgi:hypothetical protein
MTTPTLNGNELDNVTSISYTKDANILPLPFPGGDSDTTETFDMLGVTKIITVTGTYVGTTAAVKADIDILAALIDGDQDTSIVLTTDELGSLNVKIGSLDVVWDTLNNKAQYTLKLFEGS